jgi:hypothetical protein
MIPGLEECLLDSSDENIGHIAELVRDCCFFDCAPKHYFLKIQKGASSARADDTKSLKGAMLDWITPQGQPLNMSALVHCCARLVWTGQKQSKYLLW